MPSFDFKRLPVLDNTELFSSENENDYFPFHFHDYYCVSLITNGTELLHNTIQEFIAPTGSISITQANEVHRNYSLSPTGYSYKTIYVNPDVLAYCNNGKSIQALDRVIYDTPLFHHFRQLFNPEHSTPGLLEKAIADLARYATDPYESSPFERNFASIDDIIETQPDTPIDTDWLCRKFHMSKYHFIRSFKKAKGVTPQAYIMLYRLGKAKKLVLEGAPLTDIAFQCGFHDASHFNHSFKKYFGVSPSHYRQA
ncbi:MAG: AraC family transcriptional regulator [Chitinophagaceae bacterium]